MGSGRFYGTDEPSFTYAPYGDEGGGYYETTTFKTYGNGTYYGATQPTYSFAENGSGGPGYYETVTSVTEGSGAYFGAVEPQPQYADYGPQGAGYYHTVTVDGTSVGSGAFIMGLMSPLCVSGEGSDGAGLCDGYDCYGWFGMYMG